MDNVLKPQQLVVYDNQGHYGKPATGELKRHTLQDAGYAESFILPTHTTASIAQLANTKHQEDTLILSGFESLDLTQLTSSQTAHLGPLAYAILHEKYQHTIAKAMHQLPHASPEHVDIENAGTTSTAVLINNNYLHTTYIGDSVALLMIVNEKQKGIAQSIDLKLLQAFHDCDNAAERQRVKKATYQHIEKLADITSASQTVLKSAVDSIIENQKRVPALRLGQGYTQITRHIGNPEYDHDYAGAYGIGYEAQSESLLPIPLNEKNKRYFLLVFSDGLLEPDKRRMHASENYAQPMLCLQRALLAVYNQQKGNLTAIALARFAIDGFSDEEGKIYKSRDNVSGIVLELVEDMPSLLVAVNDGHAGKYTSIFCQRNLQSCYLFAHDFLKLTQKLANSTLNMTANEDSIEATQKLADRLQAKLLQSRLSDSFIMENIISPYLTAEQCRHGALAYPQDSEQRGLWMLRAANHSMPDNKAIGYMMAYHRKGHCGFERNWHAYKHYQEKRQPQPRGFWRPWLELARWLLPFLP